MNDTTITRDGNLDGNPIQAISPNVAIECVRRTLGKAAHRFEEGRLQDVLGALDALARDTCGCEHLAPPSPTPKVRPLSERLAERGLLDGGPDFEDSAEWSLDDVVGPTETPLEILARDFAAPAISGGSPEAYQPSEADWSDFADATDDDGDWYREIDAQAAGLPI